MEKSFCRFRLILFNKSGSFLVFFVDYNGKVDRVYILSFLLKINIMFNYLWNVIVKVVYFFKLNFKN